MLFSRLPGFRSIGFRIVFLNLAVFLTTCLAFFFVIDRILHRTLIDRIDADLESEILIITSRLDEAGANGDLTVFEAELVRFSRAHGIARSCFRLLDPDGTELVASDLTFWPGLPDQLTQPERLLGPLSWQTAALKPGPARLITYRFPEGRRLQVGFDLAEVTVIRQRTRRLVGWGVAAVMMFTAVLSWLVTYQGLGGIRVIDRAASAIREQGDLEVRVPRNTGSLETDRLGSTFNGMLDHIGTLMDNLRHVMDNIAHDIKTPVTRMRGVAEAELRRGEEQPMELSGRVVEECDRILNLVNTLLTITATESGLYRWEIEELDLVELVREGCELFGPLLEAKQLDLELELPDSMNVASDGRVMQRVVANLVDNAIKYSQEGGRIRVRLARVEDIAVLSVADRGIGIAANETERVFGRFYRSDRSRTLPGSGLGLSFCKAAMEGLGGGITCTRRERGGTCFSLNLPLRRLAGNGQLPA